MDIRRLASDIFTLLPTKTNNCFWFMNSMVLLSRIYFHLIFFSMNSLQITNWFLKLAAPKFILSSQEIFGCFSTTSFNFTLFTLLLVNLKIFFNLQAVEQGGLVVNWLLTNRKSQTQSPFSHLKHTINKSNCHQCEIIHLFPFQKFFVSKDCVGT